ncbi:MAG TPA: patatin-like phospholipase family protein [Thermoanaerobaculia bacterium]|nr:patatin-like phospholipase family protein [Thermoanaerobaculia bacterium]
MPSLKLHEVLEGEYVAMYGPLKVPEAAKSSDEKRLDNVIRAIHDRGDRTALCISGGGIRSATFALGIIQGLARAGLLKKFDYLSTVSGGGYVGSWLTSWIRRDTEGVEGVEKALSGADTGVMEPPDEKEAHLILPDEAKNKRESRPKLDPEPRPLSHLRQFSNYLAPRLGLLSGDSWTLVAMYIRNLLLNLLVLVPLLAAALAIPRAFSWLLEGSATLQTYQIDPVAFPWAFALFVTLGFHYLGRTRPVEYDEQQNRAEQKKEKQSADASLFLGCVLMLTIASVALAATWARYKAGAYDTLPSWMLWGPAVLAFAGMTYVPFHFYYRRLKRAVVAARRSGFVEKAEFRSYLWKKRWVELVAVIVALGTTVALWALLAAKVFDDPLRATPQLARLPPLLRFFVPSSPQAQLYVCLAVPLLLLVFFVQASIFVGLSSKRNEDSDREWWARAGAWLVFAAIVIALLNVIAVFGPIALYYAPVLLASTGGVAGLVAALVGFSDKTPGSQKEKEDPGTVAKAGNILSGLAVPLFVVFLLAAISFASTWIIQKISEPAVVTGVSRLQASQRSELTQTVKFEEGAVSVQSKETLSGPRSSIPALEAAAHLRTIQQTNGWQLIAVLAVAAAAFGLSFCIGVNKFSMNAMYRNRLIRAYLGASRWNRYPDRFSGFDEDDNVGMWQLRQELLWPSSIFNLPGFLTALKGDAPLARHIWSQFDDKQKEMFEETGPRAAGVLVASLNRLLLEGDFSAFGAHIDWITKKDGHVPYSRSLCNRAILDDAFRKYIRFMPAPADAKRALPAGAFEDQRAPMHVVNIALNLTSGENLAWQQRMATSLTVSPLHTGSGRLGYRDSREYGGDKGISLGTAVSISGAAASPNMGYHSSPVMAFLLTFFNIRLGAWLGNPGDAGDKSYTAGHPGSNLMPFLKEATGSSDSASKWVYLSDGGHFENLGLYEMVLRRCRYIVVSDGGCDPQCTFEDLGNAIRKIRIDLGIPIDVYDMDMKPRRRDGTFSKGRFIAQAHIRYSAIDPGAKDGTLIYIKSGIYKDDDLPKDVYNYAQASPLFPHEPTSDQFFSESQFESYRALGRYAVNELLATPRPKADTVRLPIARPKETLSEVFMRADEEAARRRQHP